MDVVHRIILSALLGIALTSCNNGSDNSNPTTPPIASKASCLGSEIKNHFIVKWKSGKTTYEEAESQEAVLQSLVLQNSAQNSDQVEFVEQDHMIHLDVRESTQASSASTSQPAIDWGQQMVQAPAVWTQGVNGNGVTVAVVDSGADYTHPQLRDQIALNAGEMGVDSQGRDKSNNGIDDDANGYIDDVRGYNFAEDDDPKHPQAANDPMDTNEHGTHVSGIIGAKHSAGPIHGIAEQAKILPLRFINASGAGAVSSAIKAIQYAVKAKAKVINASWGGSECSKALQDTIAGLEAQGIIFIAAAGNDNKNLDTTPSYPAAYAIPGQITVIATTELDAQAEFSNFSFTLTQIGAPGLGIVSTIPNGGTLSLDGTSMATPFVAGAAALLFGVKPTATVAQIKDALLKSVDQTSIADSAGGRLNVKKAVDLIKSM